MQKELTNYRSDSTSPQARRGSFATIRLALLAWLILISIAFFWGSQLNRSIPMDLGAPPLFGRFRFHLSLSTIPMVFVAALVVAWGNRAVANLQWRTLLAVAWATSLAWTIALNTVTGLHQLAAPLATRFEYGAAVRYVTTPARFLASFVAHLSVYPVHVQGHPPGMVLLLWALQQMGLGAHGWEAGLVIAAGTSSVMAAMVLTRAVAGEGYARWCAPFLVLAPMALWVGTSADALFLGLISWSIALTGLAMNRSGTRGRALALAGGGVFGSALMLSYGSGPLLVIPVMLSLRRRAFDRLGLFVLAIAVVLGLFWTQGFSWIDGLDATRRLYGAGIAQHRPYLFFCLANIAAFAIVVGPAGAAGLARLRNRSLWLIVGATLIALLFSDVSGYSKGEVERIWLPFAPWILVSTSELPTASVPILLSMQAAVSVALAIGVRTAW